MFDWLKKNKRICFISCLGILFMLLGIPFIINVLFKIYSPIYLFEAEWSAGDALGYYGDVLAFIGTVVLGALALYQNHIIKKEADKKAADIEEQQRIENMPKFYIRLLSASGFCGSLEFTINNVSNNIAYDIEVYDLKMKKGSNTIWESEDTYHSPAINPQKHIEIKTKSKSVTEEKEVIMFSNMRCKDKYNVTHEYILKMVCQYPNNYGETSVTEI